MRQAGGRRLRLLLLAVVQRCRATLLRLHLMVHLRVRRRAIESTIRLKQQAFNGFNVTSLTRSVAGTYSHVADKGSEASLSDSEAPASFSMARFWGDKKSTLRSISASLDNWASGTS
jgi:hypothetical protein